MQTFSKPHTDARALWLFIAGWLVLNLVQAAGVGIDSDEAYYWLYAQRLAWGYFDHPPLVALSVSLGETFGHGPFFTRLCTVFLSAGTIWFGFKLLPGYLQKPKPYLLVFASAALFHVYSFIATPDASLLFFTTLFFYAYKRFLERESAASVLLLALSIAGLLYSKYHGVLPVFFTALSYPRLFLKPRAWAAVLVALALFSPHLWWQYAHGWPTVRYHLSERIGSPYRIGKTLNYVGGQLLVWGPLTTIPALYFFIRADRKNSRYERAHFFTFWGIACFFLISSFRSTIEAHWTLAAGPSFVLLLLRVLHYGSALLQRRFSALLSATIVLLLTIRVLFLIPAWPVKNFKAFDELFYAKSWALGLHRRLAGRPVVFVDSYRLPALYRYYQPGAEAWAYHTVKNRKTQFTITGDAFLNNRPVYLAATENWWGTANFFKTPYVTVFIQAVDSYKAASPLKIRWENPVAAFKNGVPAGAIVTLHNSGADTITTDGLGINYTFLKTRSQQYTSPLTALVPDKKLPPGYKKTIVLPLRLPAAAGRYRLLFSVVQPPLAGSFASPFYKVLVE